MRTVNIFIVLFLCIALYSYGQHSIETISHVDKFKYLHEKKIQSPVYCTSLNKRQDAAFYSGLAVKQRLDSVIYEAYNSGMSQWENDHKESFIYDAYGRITSYFYYDWDDNINHWLVLNKEDYTYNTSGKLNEKIKSNWDSISGLWEQAYKSTYSYNGNGDLVLFDGYDWDSGKSQWIMEDKEEYTYDANDHMIQYLDYNLNPGNNQWFSDAKEDFTNNSNGDITMLVGYDWEASNNQWINDDKKEFTYDVNRYLTQLLDYFWTIPSSQWIYQDKQDFTYDGNGNVIQLISSDWDWMMNQWINDIRYESTFNNTYVFTDMVLPFNWFLNQKPALKDPGFFYNKELFCKHMLTGYTGKTWNSTTSQWINDSHATFYYSQFNVIGIKENRISEISVYPNPARDFVVISLQNITVPTSFQLNDLQGRKVLSKNLNPGINRVPLNGINEGIYLYRLIRKNNDLSGKLIINK